MEKCFKPLNKHICAAIDELNSKLVGISFSHVTSDSRKVCAKTIFVALTGTNVDGHNFIESAVQNGTVAAIVRKGFAANHHFGIPLIEFNDTREALSALLALQIKSMPTKIYAITGTNGKTTISYMLERIFATASLRAGVIGTLGYSIDGVSKKLSVTTPGAEELWRIFAEMGEQEVTHVAIEASSHGLDQKRVWGIEFAAGIFTNLTQDHLDYHVDMDNYFAAKAILFENLASTAPALINLDDPAAHRFLKHNKGMAVTYSIEDFTADIYIKIESMTAAGSVFEIHTPWEVFKLHLPLPGKFNIYNAAAAAGSALATGFSSAHIMQGLESFAGAPGRFSKVLAGQDFAIIVDYAHTPDALANVLTAAREFTKGKLFVVFGCGGDRDPKKRPIMGQVATQLADYAIVTSDNPRSEEPNSIIDMIIAGIVSNNYIRITDRREAIFHAISLATDDDCIVIAGKGHEDYQIFADRTIHFDDCEVARNACATRCCDRNEDA